MSQTPGGKPASHQIIHRAYVPPTGLPCLSVSKELSRLFKQASRRNLCFSLADRVTIEVRFGTSPRRAEDVLGQLGSFGRDLDIAISGFCTADRLRLVSRWMPESTFQPYDVRLVRPNRAAETLHSWIFWMLGTCRTRHPHLCLQLGQPNNFCCYRPGERKTLLLPCPTPAVSRGGLCCRSQGICPGCKNQDSSERHPLPLEHNNLHRRYLYATRLGILWHCVS